MSVLIATSPSVIPKSFKGIRREKKQLFLLMFCQSSHQHWRHRNSSCPGGRWEEAPKLLVKRPFLFRSCSDPCHSQPFLQVLLKMPPSPPQKAQHKVRLCLALSVALDCRNPLSHLFHQSFRQLWRNHLSLTFLCFSGNFTPETDSVCY